MLLRPWWDQFNPLKRVGKGEKNKPRKIALDNLQLCATSSSLMVSSVLQLPIDVSRFHRALNCHHVSMLHWRRLIDGTYWSVRHTLTILPCDYVEWDYRRHEGRKNGSYRDKIIPHYQPAVDQIVFQSPHVNGFRHIVCLEYFSQNHDLFLLSIRTECK